MTDLRQAAQAVVERWDTPAWEWRDQGPTADLMADLRTALEQPEQEPTCPKCKAAVLYECVACSNNNYPPRPEQEPCIGKDPRCPCQDGDACHYKDCVGTKARPVAQPEQEPVAWYHDDFDTLELSRVQRVGWKPLYTTPPAAPVQDVNWKDMYEKEKRRSEMWVAKYEKDIGPLEYAVPVAQRSWVGLTDEDVNRESAMIASQMKLAFHAGMYVAQQILKERNT